MNINPEQKALQSFIDLDIHTQFSNFNFNKAIYFVSYKKTLDICELFLKYLQMTTGVDIMVNVREFLSLYMICYFHNDVLSSQKNETETLLYETCKELTSYDFIEMSNHTNKFPIEMYVKKLNTFSILFSIWKKKDKESQKDVYMSLYMDYSEEIKTFISKANNINRFDEYEQYIQQLIHMKDILKKCLIKLIGHKEFTQLEQTKLNPIGIFSKKTKDVVHNYLIEAYWNIFKNNIDTNNNIIDETIVNKLGETIKDYFKAIYLDNEEKLNKVYDKVSFIIDKIIYTKNASDYLIDLIYLLYNELVFLHPEHILLQTIEKNLENLEETDTIIFTLKLLMKEFSKYKQ